MTKKKGDTKFSRRAFLTRGAAVAGTGAATAVGLGTRDVEAAVPKKWERVADVVVVGAGASGLVAAIRARDRGASVIIVEEAIDIGGRAMLSGGGVTLGGGTSQQKKFGVVDSADNVYLELTRPEHPTTRFADRKVVRAFANINVECFDFLIANGVRFEGRPSTFGHPGGFDTPRVNRTQMSSDDLKDTINGAAGSGFVRPLEKSARTKGVEILLQHSLTSIIRDDPRSGRVRGIAARNLKDNRTVNIQARKGVIACTGGSCGNVFVRTIYDPRLTEEYQQGGAAYCRQSGDAEQLGMAIGASLGATSNDRTESLVHLQRAEWIGSRDGYMRWNPQSPVFSRAGASGIFVADYQDCILVNAVGLRFHDEMVGRGLEHFGQELHDFLAAAFSSAVVDGPSGKERIGGPIWAIFDADAVKREKWDPRPPFVDTTNGYFFSADTLAELAGSLTKNRYQKVPVSAKVLQDTVARYNAFVDAGKDTDFGKPAPKYKIQTPPFYAAWATPVLHDCYSGLRINENCQVIDVLGKVIPGFYCAGESAGGFALHGLGRCVGTGYMAATHAAAESALNDARTSSARV